MDELDRILGENEALQSSSGFTERVMDALDQPAPPPIPGGAFLLQYFLFETFFLFDAL